eukprot:scaffold61394_cov24-Prasinocladus_malaysianus.AAC.1
MELGQAQEETEVLKRTLASKEASARIELEQTVSARGSAEAQAEELAGRLEATQQELKGANGARTAAEEIVRDV